MVGILCCAWRINVIFIIEVFKFFYSVCDEREVGGKVDIFFVQTPHRVQSEPSSL